jgi:hypothetical protein
MMRPIDAAITLIMLMSLLVLRRGLSAGNSCSDLQSASSWRIGVEWIGLDLQGAGRQPKGCWAMSTVFKPAHHGQLLEVDDALFASTAGGHKQFLSSSATHRAHHQSASSQRIIRAHHHSASSEHVIRASKAGTGPTKGGSYRSVPHGSTTHPPGL